MLLDAGWVEIRSRGSHHMFQHPRQPERGTVVVPHPKKELPIGTLNSILKQAGLK